MYSSRLTFPSLSLSMSSRVSWNLVKDLLNKVHHKQIYDNPQLYESEFVAVADASVA